MTRRPKRQPPQERIAFSVQLGALVGTLDFSSETDAKWMHVATEGLYLGYRGGSKPFQLTRAMFGQAVSNLRAHPQFKLGADGAGSADVVPWDFDHASEMDPTEGEKPVTGSPAQGWVLDLKVLDGADGKAQLHALTRFMEPARTYVKAGKYKWASIAASFNAKDNVTGMPIGMLLTSVALTNQPFLQALAPLAASRRTPTMTRRRGEPAEREEAVELRNYFYKADSVEDAICSLKSLFGLPATAGVAEVLTEANKLREWIGSGTTPLGVDGDEIVDGIRAIFGMDLLEPVSAVLDKVPQVVNRLIEEQAMEAGEPVPMSAGETDMALLSILATLLGVNEQENSVRDAVRDLVHLRDKIAKDLGLKDTDTPRAILAAAGEVKEKADKGAEVTAKLGTLFKALGVEDHSGAVTKVAGLMSQAAELEKAMPELKHLRDYKAEQVAASAQRDVDAVCLANKWADGMKPALLAMRVTSPEEFAKQYPLPAPGSQTAAQGAQVHSGVMQRSLVAAPNGVQLSAQQAAASIGQQQVQLGGSDDEALLASMSGNATEKAMAFLSLKQGKAFDDLTRDEKYRRAFKFNNERRARTQRAS